MPTTTSSSNSTVHLIVFEGIKKWPKRIHVMHYDKDGPQIGRDLATRSKSGAAAICATILGRFVSRFVSS